MFIISPLWLKIAPRQLRQESGGKEHDTSLIRDHNLYDAKPAY